MAIWEENIHGGGEGREASLVCSHLSLSVELFMVATLQLQLQQIILSERDNNNVLISSVNSQALSRTIINLNLRAGDLLNMTGKNWYNLKDAKHKQ